METFLVAYDIRDAKRLRKVARTCEDFGHRRQYSVFVCRLTARDLIRLKTRLLDILDLKQDRVMFLPICPRCADAIETLGPSMPSPTAHDVVIVT